jgi:hypothetical protein
MLFRLPFTIRLLRIITEVIIHRVIGFGSRATGIIDGLLTGGKGRGSRVTGNGEIDSPAISKGKS